MKAIIFINWYHTGVGPQNYGTRDAADACAAAGRIACIEVTLDVEAGEGVEEDEGQKARRENR